MIICFSLVIHLFGEKLQPKTQDGRKKLSPPQVELREAGWKRTRITLEEILFLSKFLLRKV